MGVDLGRNTHLEERFKESELTGELENCVDLGNRFGAILFCRVIKDFRLRPIANDQILLYGPDLDGLLENRPRWRRLLDPTEKQLMGYRRQRDDHQYTALLAHPLFVLSCEQDQAAGLTSILSLTASPGFALFANPIAFLRAAWVRTIPDNVTSFLTASAFTLR